MIGKRFNPWLLIWVSPRKTIRQIIEENPKKNFFLLVFLVSIAGLFSEHSINNLFVYPLITIIFPFIAYLLSLAVIYINAELLEWTGKWIGGQGNREEIRAALVWSFVPVIWSSIIKIINLTLTIEVFNNNIASSFRYVLYFVEQIISIWAIIIYLQCLGETQKFSIWKSLINSFLSLLVIVGPIAFFVGLGFYIKYLRS